MPSSARQEFELALGHGQGILELSTDCVRAIRDALSDAEHDEATGCEPCPVCQHYKVIGQPCGFVHEPQIP